MDRSAYYHVPVSFDYHLFVKSPKENSNIMEPDWKLSLIYLTAMSEISFVWNDVVKGGPTKTSGDQAREGATEKNKGIENFVNAICWILFAVEAKVSFPLRPRNIEEDSLDFKPSGWVFAKCRGKYGQVVLCTRHN